MRKYAISITGADGKPIPYGSGRYLSVISSQNYGKNAAGALDIEFDMQVVGAGLLGADTTTLTIRGLPMDVIKQSVNMANAIVTLEAGFDSVGLPLGAKQYIHYGMILQGQAFVPYANWQGVNQSLCLGLINYTAAKPGNLAIPMSGMKGENLRDVIARDLHAAFPGMRTDIQVRNNLVLPEDELAASYPSLAAYAVDIGTLSRSLANDNKYPGINIYTQKDLITVTDFTSPTATRTITLEELIGQPTWVGVDQVSIKVPLRSDINVGDYARVSSSSECAFYSPYGGMDAILTAGGGQGKVAQLKVTTFTGKFVVAGIRHVGCFRNPSADAWVSVITLSGVIS